MRSQEHLLFFLQLLILLGSSHFLGRVFRALRQPAVVGELIAGIALGPSLLGAVAPRVHGYLFPPSESGALPPGLEAFTTLGVTLLMLVAGLEMDLALVRRQGKVAIWCALFGSVIPLAFGVAAGFFFRDFWGAPPGSHPLLFAMVLGISLAMSAVPVIAKTLLDLGIYRSRVGSVILSAAMLDDLGVWLLFSLTLALAGYSVGGQPVWFTGVFTVLMVLATFTLGRRAVDLALPLIGRRLRGPGGLVAFTVCAALAMASLAIAIGVHPVFGSLLAGVAIGSSPRLRPGSREVIYGFVMSIFAPIFFASIGLRMDLRNDLDLGLAGVILLLGCAGKITGAAAGARMGGLGWRDCLAVAVGLNSRGIMGIVLGLVALEYRVIDQRLFVALAVLGIATSLISGPLLRVILKAECSPERSGDRAGGVRDGRPVAMPE